MIKIINFFAAFCLFSMAAAAAENTQITVGTAMSSHTYHQLGKNICRLINQQTNDHGISCQTKTMAGSVDNLKGLHGGGLNLGLVQSDWQSYAYEASHLFADMEPFSSLRTLSSFHPQAFTILAREAADIGTFYDLRGKKVSVGAPDSEEWVIFERLMQAYRWSPQTFSSLINSLPAAEQAQALCDGDLDAAVYMLSHPSPIIERATKDCALRLVRVNGKPVQRMMREGPHYKWFTIPRALYERNDEAIRTFGAVVNLVASVELDEDVAYHITRVISSHAQELAEFAPVSFSGERTAMGEEDAAMTDAAMMVPLHPGALKYKKETEMQIN